MFGITQNYILNTFKKYETECKILALKMSNDSNINKVKYLSTIQLPKRTINCFFECYATKNEDSKVATFITVFNFGNISIDLNNNNDVEKVLRLFKKICEFNGSSNQLKDKSKDILKNIEKEIKESTKESTKIE